MGLLRLRLHREAGGKVKGPGGIVSGAVARLPFVIVLVLLLVLDF
jgi:hypothetical protein